jgi:hypothetical protein
MILAVIIIYIIEQPILNLEEPDTVRLYKMVGIICYRGKTSKGQISKERKKPPKKKHENLSQADRCIRSKEYTFHSDSPINFYFWYIHKHGNYHSHTFSFEEEIPSFIKELLEYHQALKVYNDHVKSLRLAESREKFRQSRKEQFQISKNTSHKPTHRGNHLPIQSRSANDAIFDSFLSIY